MRTFGRDAFVAARQAWDDGDFGPSWDPYRRAAAESGFIYPPSGSKYDDREDEHPSQRSIVWRAIEDNPSELLRIIRRASSWQQVVDRVIGLEERLREDASLRLRDDVWDRDRRPTGREAAGALASVFERIASSLGYVKADDR